MASEMTIRISDFGDASFNGITKQLEYWNVKHMAVQDLGYTIVDFGDTTESQIIRQLRYWRVKGIVEYYDNTELIL